MELCNLYQFAYEFVVNELHDQIRQLRFLMYIYHVQKPDTLKPEQKTQDIDTEDTPAPENTEVKLDEKKVPKPTEEKTKSTGQVSTRRSHINFLPRIVINLSKFRVIYVISIYHAHRKPMKSFLNKNLSMNRF